MKPVFTPEQIKAADAEAQRLESIESIVARVGSAVARVAIRMLGGRYGRRVTVIAGPGLNGEDGRATATALERHGVRVTVLDATELPNVLPHADLVIDAAFGIGLNKPWVTPKLAGTPVLSIDIPSGLDGLTGQAQGDAIEAVRTVALMGYKPGLLLADGPKHAGAIEVVDIGVGGSTNTWLLEEGDLFELLPDRAVDAHKWNHALLAIAGAPGMSGAAVLVCAAAQRAGAGYIHLDTAAPEVPGLPIEVVGSFAGRGRRPEHDRFAAAVIGPGLGRTAHAGELVRTVLSSLEMPVVVDADGIGALAVEPSLVAARQHGTVLTPHDGEFEQLTGHRPGADRIAEARDTAAHFDAVLVLKGPTTIVASPGGEVRLCSLADQRLATAGTGDVLSGIVGALLARGVTPFDAATAGVLAHAMAAQTLPSGGLIASDLCEALPAIMGSR